MWTRGENEDLMRKFVKLCAYTDRVLLSCLSAYSCSKGLVKLDNGKLYWSDVLDTDITGTDI